MNANRDWSRRDVLRGAVTGSAFLATPLVALMGTSIAMPKVLRGESCSVTPEQPEGPFYMGGGMEVADGFPVNDLTRLPAAPRAAEGEVIQLAGRVTGLDCRPVAGARVEIWQACVTGRYAHHRDNNPAPVDPYFRNSGHFITDSDGTYQFRTIKPGQYPISVRVMRPAHIHFLVRYGGRPVLTTQMYFAGDPYNTSDPLLSRVAKSDRQQLVIEPVRNTAAGVDRYSFDLALPVT